MPRILEAAPHVIISAAALLVKRQPESAKDEAASAKARSATPHSNHVRNFKRPKHASYLNQSAKNQQRSLSCHNRLMLGRI